MLRYKLLLLPIGIFVALFVPFLYVIPANDGNLEFKFANSWFIGNNRIELLSLHPPFKLILFSLFFKLFGYNSIGYIGLIFGIAGIIALYFIAKKLFDKQVALLSSILLATSGQYISVGLFGIHDFLMTVLILIAFAFYLNSRYLLYTIFICIAILTKETAIFFAASILISDITVKKNVSFVIFAPIVLLAWYVEFLHFSGYHLWNDWNFSNTAKDGSALTMIYNVVTFQIFNKYALENILHLFVFNFNWIYWIFVIVSFFYIKTKEMKKNLIPIGIFAFVFTLLVLTFQTFTINRYILPLLPFVYMLASYAVFKLKFPSICISLLLIASFVSLFFSVDPVSNLLWQKTPVLSENLYLNELLDGDDGITYNMQYLSLMKERTTRIEKGECGLPPLINNDTLTLILLNKNTCK
jgi:4-amino-4-deoxy-L-arabinose transferase-like glycosyltransferase